MNQRPTASQPGIPVTVATVTADQAPSGPATTVIAATNPITQTGDTCGTRLAQSLTTAYRKAGASVAEIEEAELLLARGIAFTALAQAAETSPDQGQRTLIGLVDELAHQIAAHHSLAPLAARIQAEQRPAIPGQRAGETAEPEPPRTFTLTLRNGATLPLPEPAGCTTDHTEDRFPEDVTHELGHVPGIILRVDTTRDGDEIELLEAGLHVEPYVADERCRKPYILLEGALGEYMEPLDADRFGQVIADLHAHLDRFAQLHDQLIEATAEWEAGR